MITEVSGNDEYRLNLTLRSIVTIRRALENLRDQTTVVLNNECLSVEAKMQISKEAGYADLLIKNIQQQLKDAEKARSEING